MNIRNDCRPEYDNDENDNSENDGDPFAKYSSKVSSWTPPEGKFSALDHYIDLCRRQVSRSNFKKRTAYSNLSLTEKQALDRLSKRDDIVIKPADKGVAVVVWARTLYLEEAQRHLSDARFYQRLNQDCTKKSQQTVKSVVHDLIGTCELPPTASNLIVTTPRTSQFYLLPKIHKPNHPGRPIVSACSCPTENISAYLDEVMAPLARGLSSYVKETNHVLQIFDSFHFDPGQAVLHLLTVQSAPSTSRNISVVTPVT